MQARLTAVGFDPGPIDGIFGGSTLRSVWAFEKIVLGITREEMKGVVTPDVWDRMHQPTGVHPRRSPGGTHMEVYLPEQVGVLFTDGNVRLISHVHFNFFNPPPCRLRHEQFQSHAGLSFILNDIKHYCTNTT